MASRPTKDNTPTGKEKRGTSPSNFPTTARTTTTRGRSPNPPKKPASPARTHDPIASERSVPNYLKGTISSVDNSKQQVKKPVLKTETGMPQKPALVRRRSFDKTSATSHSQKSLVSPSPTLRSSSSFSGKITSPQRSLPDRNSKTPKEAGKQHTLYARPVNTAKKTGIYVKKHEAGVNSSSAKEKIVVPREKVEDVNIHEVPEPETHSEDQETVQSGDGIEKGEKDSFPENQEPISHDQIVNLEPSTILELVNNEETENKDAKSVTFDSSTVLEHQQQVGIEQTNGKSESMDDREDSVVDDQEPINIKQIEDDNENNDTEVVDFESTGNLEHENTKVVDIVESLDTKEPINEMNTIINNDDESVAHISENVEEKKMEEEEICSSKKDEAASDDEARETKEKEVEVVGEKKAETVNAGPIVQMAHGKKEIAVSNDVIEETASKLREQRKNKVRALAGAFESVISLQDK